VGVRRQIYIAESDNRLLDEVSKSSGLSVSELIRRAISQCYGARRPRTAREVFSFKVRVGSADGDGWVYDPLFDDEYMDDALREAGLEP
jgi:ribbon-helix-helix CopG family protein